MNNNTLYNNILTIGGLVYPFLPDGLLFYKELLPKSSAIDYIELKTKLGGKSLNLSMYENSFNTYAKTKASNVYPTTSDLNLVSINQPQTKYRVRTVFIPLWVRMGV